MYGDEVDALVFDIGSSSVKAGYAGEDTPKAIFPSAVGILAGEQKAGDGDVEMKDAAADAAKGNNVYHLGTNELTYRRDNMEIRRAVKDRTIVDWDIVDAIIDHTFKTRLSVDPQYHPVLFSEAALNTKESRERLCQLMFEKYKVPAFFIVKDAVLSAFASGRSSALVLDCGADVVTATPVHDGYVLTRAVRSMPIGGEVLTGLLTQRLEDEYKTPVRPNYAFKKNFTPEGELKSVTEQSFPATHKSFHEYMKQDVSRDVKESVCRVSDSRFEVRDNETIPTQPHELPDGANIDFGADRFSIPELMFYPSDLKPEMVESMGFGKLPTHDGAEGTTEVVENPTHASASRFAGVHRIVYDAISACDVDVRRDLYHNVVITGGASLPPTFADRLQKELQELVPNSFKLKIICPTAAAERKYSTWIGGSILASLGSFQQMWMSKIEYDEHGVALLERRCP